MRFEASSRHSSARSPSTRSYGPNGGLFNFIAGDASYSITKPSTGLVRIAVQGDWTNAGTISGDIEILRHRTNLGRETIEGHVGQGESVSFTINVPAGTQQAVFETFWGGTGATTRRATST